MSGEHGPAGALISALRGLEAAVKELLTISYDKRRAIIGGDTERLAEITSAETRLITAVNAAERRRLAAMPGAATLDGAISGATAETRGELARLKRELAGAMRLLLDMNERSRRLLEERLNYTSDCIGALTLPEEPEGDIYTADGRLSGGRDRGYYIGDA